MTLFLTRIIRKLFGERIEDVIVLGSRRRVGVEGVTSQGEVGSSSGLEGLTSQGEVGSPAGAGVPRAGWIMECPGVLVLWIAECASAGAGWIKDDDVDDDDCWTDDDGGKSCDPDADDDDDEDGWDDDVDDDGWIDGDPDDDDVRTSCLHMIP